MIEIFLRDRDIDYEMLVYDNGLFNYIIKEKNDQNNALYFGLERGTIILNGIVLNNMEVTLEQVNYIKEILNSLTTIVDAYKKNYKPVYIRYTSGSSVEDIIMNKNVIEIPDIRKFREWIYINAYDFLEKFVCEYEKQSHLQGLKRKILNFFTRY